MKKETENFSMVDVRNQTKQDKEFSIKMNDFFDESLGTNMDKLRNFTKFVPRQNLSLFLAKNLIFEKILNIHGHIIECGVFLGGGLTTWGQLSAIYEPYNNVRRIIGFDNFSGFEKIHEKDKLDNVDFCKEGGMGIESQEDIKNAIKLFDLNRPIGHIPRIDVVKGDALQTIPNFLEENPHLVVSLLYLDFDLYEPTKIAIEKFLPRMPKGAIIAFDELNQKSWPGETQAVFETIGINNLKIQRFPFTPQISYAILK